MNKIFLQNTTILLNSIKILGLNRKSCLWRSHCMFEELQFVFLPEEDSVIMFDLADIQSYRVVAD